MQWVNRKHLDTSPWPRSQPDVSPQHVSTHEGAKLHRAAAGDGTRLGLAASRAQAAQAHSPEEVQAHRMTPPRRQVSKPPISIEMHHERLVGQDRHCPCSIDHLSLKGHLYLTGRDVSDRERGGTDHPKGEAPTVRRRSPRDIGKTGTYTSWLAHAHCMATRWRTPTRNATSTGDACRTPTRRHLQVGLPPTHVTRRG
jgi:hypothetical protein